MVKCPSCGADVADGIKFCCECGARVPQDKKCSAMTENEQKYFDEVVAVLKAKGNIGFMDRPKLARLGTSLGLPLARTLVLDGEAKTFLKQESARLAEEERLRKEQEAAAAEERRKAEQARIRAEREAAEAEERRRKDEEKRKKAEEEARKKQEEAERMSPCSAEAATDSKLVEETSSPVKANENGKNAKSSDSTGCVIVLVLLVCTIVAFWTGHWIIGIILAVFSVLGFVAEMSNK